MSQKSDTPKTDAAEKDWQENYDNHYKAVGSDFARQLERELAVAKEAITHLHEELDRASWDNASYRDETGD